MASIKDVAKAAGVAIGTVSRAFNDYEDISDGTKQRIFQVAKELGYTPNIIAKSLSSKVKSNIGIIVSGLLNGNSKDNLLFMTIKGVYRYTLENDLEVALYTTDSNKQRTKSYTQFCMERSISGAILSGITTDDAYFKELIDAEIPCVTIDVPVNGKLVGCVSIDNSKAVEEMTRHLFSLNHKKMMIIAGKKNASVSEERISGINRTFAAEGIVLNKNHIIYCDFSEEIAFKKVSKYLAEHGKSNVTAFFCLSDIMALGVLRAIREAGYSVPEDFSLAGFDGIPVTEYTHPPITTISQDMDQIGYAGAKLLKDIIKGEAAERRIILPHKLIVRESTRQY